MPQLTLTHTSARPASAGPQLSLTLSVLMRHGGGEIVPAYRGGLGRYLRLEGNTLLGRPLPVAEGIGRDGVTKLFPATIAPWYNGSAELTLIPLTSARLAARLDPKLYALCRVHLVITHSDDDPDPTPPPTTIALAA